MSDEDWDASSDDDAPTASKAATTQVTADQFDDSDPEPAEVDPTPADDAKAEPKPNVTPTNNSKNTSGKNNNSNEKQSPNNNNNNKNNNNKQKQKQKQKQQKGKAKPPAKQISTSNKKKQTADNDSDSTTSSDDSDDDDETQNKNNSKMQSYDDRFSEDNAILFGAKTGRGGRGGRGRGRGSNRGGRGGGGRGQTEDNRVMLSGDVRLSSFPLGSQRDCVNLAQQLSGLINQKRFDGDINSMDIVKFVTYMIDGLVTKNSQHMDIVDINEIKTQVDKIYNRKQKEMRAGKKKKKPIHRFGKKYSAGPSNANESNQASQGGGSKHVDGHYNPNDFDFLD